MENDEVEQTITKIVGDRAYEYELKSSKLLTREELRTKYFPADDSANGEVWEYLSNAMTSFMEERSELSALSTGFRADFRDYVGTLVEADPESELQDMTDDIDLGSESLRKCAAETYHVSVDEVNKWQVLKEAAMLRLESRIYGYDD